MAPPEDSDITRINDRLAVIEATVVSINARIDKDKADRAEISEKVAALHNFLMEEGVDGDPPMKKRLSVIVVTGERSVWALKWVSRLIGFVAILTGVVVGIVKLRG